MPKHIHSQTEAHMTRALLALRVTIVRECQPGLEHVEALLRLRGVDPAEHRVPAKRPPEYRRSEVINKVRQCLQTGPKTARELRELTGLDVRRVERALQRLRKNGEVVRDGRVWGAQFRRSAVTTRQITL